MGTKKPTGVQRVLDRGFVYLVGCDGTDQDAIRAARVSYGSKSSGDEADKKLLFYLMEHGHHTPFEQIYLKFHVKCPLFTARQWFRHRICSYSEASGRYKEFDPEFYMPDIWRVQDTKNKQSSVGCVKDQERAKAIAKAMYSVTYEAYKDLMVLGVAKEQARLVLPSALYTEFYWAINMRSLMNFLSLRADEHAQWEIRQYAEAIARIVSKKLPWTFQAYLVHCWKGKNDLFDSWNVG